MRAPATRLAYIDGWRVLAIMLVFLDHLGANREIGAFYEASPIGFISQYGETGVFIFFFISGYVVSRPCLAEVESSGAFSAPAFYARRFFRIVPPLMLYLAFCLALGAAGLIDFSPENFLSAALYLCNTTAPGVSCNWYVGHTWSLAFEEQFYWLFPVAFAYLELGKAPRPIAAAALLFAAAPFAFPVWWIGKTGFVIAYALFFAGYAAAKHGERVIAASQGCRVPALIAAMVIVFLPRGVVACFGQDEAARAQFIAYYRLLYIAAIPAMVLLSGATGPFRSMLSNRAFAYVGRASYSIYLWQQLCNGPVFNDLEAIAELALTAAMAGCCLLLFPLELKLAGYGHALSKRLQARRGAAVSASAIPPAAAAVLE